MSVNNYIINLLGIKDTNIHFTDEFSEIDKNGVKYNLIVANLTYTPTHCPHCHSINNNSIIKHGKKATHTKLPTIAGYPTILKLYKQRFFCKHCGSTFIASTTLVDRHSSISNPLKKVIHMTSTKKISEKDIASIHCVSHSTVSRCIDNNFTSYSPSYDYLPKHLCFDEFKSTKNAKGSMSFIYCDAKTHEIIDIVESRKGSSFNSLFTSRSCDCVLLIVEFTPFNALSRPVVSPPISTVIPFILFATYIPPFLKVVIKKLRLL